MAVTEMTAIFFALGFIIKLLGLIREKY